MAVLVGETDEVQSVVSAGLKVSMMRGGGYLKAIYPHCHFMAAEG